MGLSLDKLETYGEANYKIKLYNDRLRIENYDDFLDALHNDLDWCVSKIQEKAKYLQPDENGEDRVSAHLQDMLESMLYSAKAEYIKGGNTDFTIRTFNEEYTWIGEAKLIQGVNNTHIWGGFLQLVTRYTSGVEPNGGMLIYIFAPDANLIMNKYKEFTKSKSEYGFRYCECPTRKIIGGFYTIHKHIASGIDFKTRHIPVIMYHAPEK